MSKKLSNLAFILIILLSACDPPNPETNPESFVAVPANDSTPPTVTMIVSDDDVLYVDVNETSQATTKTTRSEGMGVTVGATDNDGGIKVVSLWATYTYSKPGQNLGPELAGAPIQQYVSNAKIGESTLKKPLFVHHFELRKELGCWSTMQVDVWAEGENFSGGKVRTPVVSITYYPRLKSIPILEGHLYQDSSSKDMYVIHSGKKIRIPTSDALLVMGYSSSDVEVVGDGALNCYTPFDIPSLSSTPGSLVFPPDEKKHFPLKGVVPNATILFSQDHEIQLVELRGWLRGVAGEDCQPFGDGFDFHYELELDTEWAIAQGIDLNGILRVGNIAMPEASMMLTGFSPRKAVSVPLLKIELDSWGRDNKFPPTSLGSTPPVDWPNKGICDKIWPFDPFLRNLGVLTLTKFDWSDNRGPYVRIAGSLVTDSPHDFGPCVIKELGLTIPLIECPLGAGFSGNFAISWWISQMQEWQGSVRDWSPGLDTGDPAHYARWTEIHPPDLIEVIGQNDTRFREPSVTTRGVALNARVGKLVGGLSNSCEEVEFDIFPDVKKPTASSQIAYEELRGPETYFPWGENADNGSWITPFGDHIRVKARVCGGAIFGSPGRFKAIYRVWWKEQEQGAGQIFQTGSFVTTDNDEIQYVIEPNTTVASDKVEFQLCLGPGLNWEKRMNVPDGLGNSWDLVVKDNKRCDTNSLSVNQVLNGQVLTFSKAKVFGNVWVVQHRPLSDFGTLPGGTRVTFTWVKD